MKSNNLRNFLGAFLLVSLSTAMAGTLTSYISAPGVQISTGSGGSFVTESFDNFTVGPLPSSGSLANGTYVDRAVGSTSSTIGLANDYGGACSTASLTDTQATACSGGTRTKFLTGNLTITLGTPAVYVGFWWSAGSNGNTVQFLDQNNSILATYTTDNLITLLSANSVTTIDNHSYLSANYKGNPTTITGPRAATNEPFTYLHLLMNNTTSRIAKIKIYGAGFELDNLTTGNTLPAVENSWVQVSQATTSEFVTVGGSLTGLDSSNGKTVTLRNNGGNALTLSANGPFTFSNSILVGGTYAVTVGTQPNGQVCTVSSDSGTANSNVSTVNVSCASNYTVGGSLTGLDPNQMVTLTNNGGDALTLSANGPFTFSSSLLAGAVYAVTIGTQPNGQVCTVSNDAGNANSNISNVAVSCVAAVAAPIPTLSEWAMIFMASLMAMFGIRRMRRQ